MHLSTKIVMSNTHVPFVPFPHTSSGIWMSETFGLYRIQVELAVSCKFKRWICSLQNAEILNTHDVRKTVAWKSVMSQGPMKAAGRARMRETCKVYGTKCMVFSVSVLSHASVILNFMYGKLLHARKWLKQVPWLLYVKRLSYLHLFTCQLNMDTI